MKEFEYEDKRELKNNDEQHHYNYSFALNHSENTSEKKGLVFVTYVASWSEFNNETFEEICFEQEKHEWNEAGSEIKTRLKYLRDNAECGGYSLYDCKVSLAEYAEPELEEKNIISIKSLVLRIFHNYYFSQEEAVERILEHCSNKNLPVPNEIICVVNGYYVKWNFINGFKGSEIELWKFIQKKLHEKFGKINSDTSECLNATAMIPVPGFTNSNYIVPFDLCEKTTLVYGNDELYVSLNEFVSKLSLSISEIAEYQKIKETSPSYVKIVAIYKIYNFNFNKKGRRTIRIITAKIIAQNEVKRIRGGDIEERARNWLDNLACAINDENCSCEEYRYYQCKTAGKIKKNYKWLEINGRGLLPKFDGESDSWISAAKYYSRFRRKGNVASINCNFLIINWKKSTLEFTPTPEQGKELVLSRCHELGLPEPEIISTPDGLEIKWFWNDRMTKILYKHDLFNSKFNNDWDRIQKKLYEKFWYLGADPKKLCVTVMFRIPGSKDTRKTLKKSADRIIREIHKGETVESYRNIQRVLGIPETRCEERTEIFDEIENQKWERFSLDNSELAKDWEADVLRIHPSSKNWVCFGFIDENRKWNNRWVQAFELRKNLLKFIHKPEFSLCDFYVSQGEFFSRNNRTVNNFASINVSFVDLDYKILVIYRPEIIENPSPEEWEKLVKAHCEKFEIPLPNDVVFSGGGVHLKWIYDEPISRSELELWKYAQNLLLSQFKTLGADPASSDAARVLRLVGTENHKNSEIIKERTVHVIDREFFSGIKISLSELVEVLEKSRPENPEEINSVKSEWQKTLSQLSIKEAKMFRPNSAVKADYDSENYRLADNYYWLENTLRHHKLHATYLAAEISGVRKWIETYQLHNTLKLLYGTPNLKISLSELKEQEISEKREAIEWIPCNYVMLSHCPGDTFEEQKKNIFNRCHEYRGVGFQEPNQIIKIGNTLLVEWTYQSILTGRALSRWQVTQEFICRHFSDWGAMDDSEYLKATALLPVPGFEYDGEIARLEYSELTKRYTFNRLAKAVLPYSQKEAKEGKEKNAAEKAKHELVRKIAFPEEVSKKFQKAPNNSMRKFNGDFQTMALMRFADIVKFLELQKLENGEIPQNTRELCCFWALVFAKQAGLITTYEEFKTKAEELIRFCGLQFSTECTVKTLETAYTKNYSATTAFLISRLQITPEYQKHMKVLLIGVRATARKHQPREEWLAEHTQEREKPWEKLGICRATYFNWKKVGKLPAQIEKENDSVISDSILEFESGIPKNNLDWCIYIMSARLIALCIHHLYLLLILRKKLYRCAFLSFSFNYFSCLLFRVLSSCRLVFEDFPFLKRRRGRGKRKRKRRRLC